MEEKLKKHREELFCYALRLVGNEMDAEDLLHETFLKALINKEKFVGEGVKAWLYAIMRNHFINDFRKNKKLSMIFDNNQINNSFDMIESTSPDSIVDEKYIWGLINELESDFRIPFQMYIDGFKYIEISEIMDMNINTVKSRIFIARGKLSKRMKM